MSRLRSLATLALIGAVFCAGCNEPVTPTSPETASSPVTETFASRLTPLGTASRTFTVQQTGSVLVTLTSVTPPATIGVGVGIPRADGSGCSLAHSVETGAGEGPHITTTAEGGNYCVKVYDPARLAEPVSFSLTFQRP